MCNSTNTKVQNYKFNKLVQRYRPDNMIKTFFAEKANHAAQFHTRASDQTVLDNSLLNYN